MEANHIKDKEVLFESISALVDDELTITEKINVIAEVKQDAELLEKWRHFYIIKKIMQRKRIHSGLSTNEFVSKVIVHTDVSDNTSLSNQQNPEH